MARKLLKNPLVITALAKFYRAYMTFCFRTARVEVAGGDTIEKFDHPGQPLIVAFWHGRMAYMPMLTRRPEHTHVLISRHGDGELITRAMEQFGLKALRGSSNRAASDGKGYKNRGGTQALREGLKVLKAGDAVAVTPDGPRGPRFVAQPGIITLAQMSGAPIIPITFSAAHARVIRSWDRFLLPKPFRKAIVLAGEPLLVARELDDAGIENARKILEDRLNEITRRADQTMGILGD